jgi:hypothetical protein
MSTPESAVRVEIDRVLERCRPELHYQHGLYFTFHMLALAARFNWE